MPRQNGIKFSRPGVSVDKVADYDSYFFTGWPWLKIAFEGDVFVGSAGASVPNPVGYPCFYMIIGKTTGLREAGSSITKDTLTLDYAFGFLPQEMVHYILFTLPLKEPYSSDTVNAIGIGSGARSDYGVKFNPSGIKGSNDKNYVMNSDYRSPLIHKVIAGNNAPLTLWSGYGIEWTIDLPYQPLMFGFYSVDRETFVLVTTTAQTPPKIIFPGIGPWASGGFKPGSVVVSGIPTAFSTLVILKNPADFGKTVNVEL